MDNDCGYADGDGPCTSSSGMTVCRSGACSTSGVCEPSGGCENDADCTGGNWCDETSATCTPKLANGTSIPVDGPHMNPTLDGECIPAAAMLVCESGVCDIKDNKCGYADSDGPCSSTNAGTVCRSGACSTNGTCEPMGGCNVDGDCPGATCNTTTHACQALPDAGTPTDGGDGGGGGDASMQTDGGSTSEGGSSPDGSVIPTGDGGPAGADASSAGYLDGGGLSCGVTATGGGPEPILPGFFAALGLVAAARRRRGR
jgi:MYXO-CTERM domain-containing protein